MRNRRDLLTGGALVEAVALSGCLDRVTGHSGEAEFEWERIENKEDLFGDNETVPVFVIVSNVGNSSGALKLTVRVYDEETLIGAGSARSYIVDGSRVRVPVIVEMDAEGGETVDVELLHMD